MYIYIYIWKRYDIIHRRLWQSASQMLRFVLLLLPILPITFEHIIHIIKNVRTHISREALICILMLLLATQLN